MGNSKGFAFLRAAKYETITIFYQKQHLGLKNVIMGSMDHVTYLFKHYNNSFRLLSMHFEHGKKKVPVLIFLFVFPIGYIGGLR